MNVLVQVARYFNAGSAGMPEEIAINPARKAGRAGLCALVRDTLFHGSRYGRTT